MPQITVYFDVTNKTIQEIELMHSLYGATFPFNNGKCFKWTLERKDEHEAKES